MCEEWMGLGGAWCESLDLPGPPRTPMELSVLKICLRKLA